MSHYIYYVHDDGDMMLLADFNDDDGTTRWTPFHRVSDSNMPVLFKTDARVQKWINYPLPRGLSEKLLTAKWEGVERIRANPFGTKGAVLKNMRVKK